MRGHRGPLDVALESVFGDVSGVPSEVLKFVFFVFAEFHLPKELLAALVTLDLHQRLYVD